MKHVDLENQLRAHIKKRRIIAASISATFLSVLIVFSILYNQSKVVNELGWGPIKNQSVTYNYNLTWGIMVGVLGLIPALITFLADYMFSKLATFEINGDHITFYRSIVHTALYINGAEKDRISLGYYLEATLSDKSKVNVALGKWSAHITFSNGHPPIDV